MARIARVVVPHYPHHITQRGSRRQQTFFSDNDYRRYIDILAFNSRKYAVDIWAYCLMPNHIHVVATPNCTTGLSDCFSRTHRAYALEINQRNKWQGHLWQERFHSFVMDETHLLCAVRYIEQNPVRAGLCTRPEDWTWSSAGAHLIRADDKLVNVRPMLTRVNNWNDYIESAEQPNQVTTLRKHSRTGRPLGDKPFLQHLEKIDRPATAKTQARTKA